MIKALFITLDDTLIFTKSGRKYPVHSKDWRINMDILAIVKKYVKAGYKIIILDNQESVAEGYVDITVFDEKISDIVDIIENRCGVENYGISYMFWTGKRDEYYKLPSPGLSFECALEYELDLPNSVLIGNCAADRQFGINSGIVGYMDVNENLDNYETN